MRRPFAKNTRHENTHMYLGYTPCPVCCTHSLVQVAVSQTVMAPSNEPEAIRILSGEYVIVALLWPVITCGTAPVLSSIARRRYLVRLNIIWKKAMRLYELVCPFNTRTHEFHVKSRPSLTLMKDCSFDPYTSGSCNVEAGAG